MGASGAVVKYYENDVYNLAYRMPGNRGDAEDAAQEAFLRAFNKLHRYDPDRSFKTWLYAITSNYCIDVLRKRRMSLVSLDNESLPAFPQLHSDEPLPEIAFLNNERDETIQNLLNDLAEDERLIIVVRYWQDLSYTEIAEITGMTGSAVKGKLFRTRRKLAMNYMEEEAVEQ